MSTMTLGHIAHPDFTKAMEKLVKEPLPIKVAYKVRTLTSLFNAELQKYNQLRLDILASLADKDDKGNPILVNGLEFKLSPENGALAVERINELMSIEVPFEAISVETLGNNVTLSAQELFALGSVIGD